MTQSIDAQKQHQLFVEFIREFAHVLRTPLSVVFHELQYIEQTSDIQNIHKAIGKSEDIIATLKTVTDIFAKQDATAHDILAWLFPDHTSVKRLIEESPGKLVVAVECSGSSESIADESPVKISQIITLFPGLSMMKAHALDLTLSHRNMELFVRPNAEGAELTFTSPGHVDV